MNVHQSLSMRAAWCAVAAATLLAVAAAAAYEPRADQGYSAGLIPDCPGVMKNVSIKPESLPLLQVVVYSLENGKPVRRSLPIASAHRTILKKNYLDFSKKTMVYACGFWDSSVFPPSMALANSYARRGYNVLIMETFDFYTYIYPKAVRVSRLIGSMMGQFLARLSERGLAAERLELVGVSLGAHSLASCAKHYLAATGSKPARITGLDPAGPCFRALPPDQKLSPDDAHRVDVVHTNIDGFGIAERLGHVDFYVNGGEYQPGDIEYVPCLVICSHVRSVLYYWQALEHPRQFVGMQCPSVQDARLARCYGSPVTNSLGLETNFSRPGVFYLSTSNQFPYYRGRAGLDADNEIYTQVAGRINSDDLFEA